MAGRNNFNSRNILCREFARGTCQRGSSCRFSHDRENSLPETTCLYFLNGNCLFGNWCRYAHIRPYEVRIPIRTSIQPSGNPNNSGDGVGTERRNPHSIFQFTVNFIEQDAIATTNPAGSESATVPGSSRNIINIHNQHSYLYYNSDDIAFRMHNCYCQALYLLRDYLISLDYITENGVTQATINIRSPGEPSGPSALLIERNTVSYIYRKEQGNSDDNNSTQEICSICLSDFEDGVNVRRLRCMHFFHETCIGRWLSSNRKCPVCRANIVELVVTL